MIDELTDPTLDLPRLLGVLNGHRVEYVVIGGLAINVHGVARATYDLEVAITGGAQNLRRGAAALAELNPSLRGAPTGLPITFDAATLGGAETWTLRTDAGDLDLMVRPEGTTGYGELVADALVVDVFGTTIRVASFDAMRRMKRAAGRPKDLGDSPTWRHWRRPAHPPSNPPPTEHRSRKAGVHVRARAWASGQTPVEPGSASSAIAAMTLLAR